MEVISIHCRNRRNHNKSDGMANLSKALSFYFGLWSDNISKLKQTILRICEHEVKFLVSNFYHIWTEIVQHFAGILPKAKINEPQKPNGAFEGQFKLLLWLKSSFRNCACALVCGLWPQNGGQIHDQHQKLPLLMESGVNSWTSGTA